MEIWLIRNGEKSGPFHDYEIRQKISAGDLESTVPAWHEGLAEWKAISELDLFRKEFELKAAPEPPPTEPLPASPPVAPPPLPGSRKLARRFWARWLDLHLYSAVWWLTMYAAGRDIGAMLTNPWVMVPQLLPWFILEAFMIHRFGTTPGKALLGLRVTNQDGSPLTLAAASHRSFRVLIVGIGFGWGPVAILCQALSFFTTKKLGNPLWDFLGKHQVTSQPVNPLRVVTFAVLFFTAIQLQLAVLSPYYMKNIGQSFPELRERIEQNPPFHLPPKHKVPEPAPPTAR